MKLRTSDYGLILSVVPAVLIFGSWGVISLHAQGKDSANLVAESSQSSLYLKEVKKDIESLNYWEARLGVNEGKKVGDQLDVPKPGTLGPRTVLSIPLPGKTQSPNQVFRVDQNTGKILHVFSNKQIKEAKEEEKS